MTVRVLVSVSDHVVVASICSCLFFHYPLCIPLPSKSTSAGHGSLPGGVTQTFTPEGSGPLVILPGLGCCKFLVTLITGHDNTKRHPKGSPMFHIYSFLISIVE